MGINSPKYVALTFDDGPSAYTFYILDILKQNHIPATFFIVGTEAEKFQNIVRRIHAEGHMIGNHTWSHPDITAISENKFRREIEATNKLLKKLTGYSPYLFRPPYSAINRNNEVLLQKLGMTPVIWNVDSQDWCENSPALIQHHVISGLKDHSLIIMHDGDQYGSGPRDQTVASLNKIIKYLLDNGYQFVTVPEFHQLAYKI